MIDRNKVINELRFQLDSKEVKDRHCPVQLSVSDANAILALLKDKDAVEPIKMQRMDDFSYYVSYFLCGNCRYELEGKDVMFCAHCGKMVKWND